MKNLHIHIATIALLGCAAPMINPEANAAVRPTEAAAPKLPEIWLKAGPRERLKATRAAELDADRLLIERIYGIQIDSNTTVGDLAMRDDSIAGAASSTLVGSLTVGEPEYFDDGRVEVVKSVTIQQVIETLRRKTKEKLRADGSTELIDFDEKTEVAKQDKTLDVMGNSALPGSLGHQKIMAKRAAELDAYRRLAQRLMSIQIDSQTTVRDACLENDEIVASLSQLIKGAEPTDIRHLDDGSCEVDMQVTKGDLVRAVTKSDKGRTHTTRIEDAVKENSYSVTGRGTMHPPEPSEEAFTESDVITDTEPQASSPRQASADVFFETETIIRRLLESNPVQR